MASRYWVLDSGTWDNSTTTNWSATSGGAGGASVPGVNDDVILDANSCLLNGTITPNYNLSVKSITMGAFTGTLDFSANNNSPTMQTFSCSGTGTRTLNMGSGTWTLTGNNATIWNTSTTTNLTLTSSGTIVCNYSGGTGTRFFNNGTGGAGLTQYPNVSITAGTDIFAFTSGSTPVGTINYTGFSGIAGGGGGSTVNFTGDITFSATMTAANVDLTHAWTAQGTGTQNFTSNGVILYHQIFKAGGAGTLVFADALNLGGGSLNLTSGNMNANNQNITAGSFASSNSTTRTLTMGSGTWTLTGTGTVWNTATNTNLTVTATSSTMKVTDSSNTTNTLAFGSGKTFGNLYLSRGASTASNSITGSPTFLDIKDDGSTGHSLLFQAGQTIGFSTWNVNGAGASNLITLSSSTSATHTLKNNGTSPVLANYLSISYSIAT